MRRVVITGYGLISALGNDVPTAFARLHKLENAVERSEELQGYQGMQTALWAPAHFDLPARYNRRVIRTMGRESILSLNAAEQALAQAGLLDDPLLKSGRAGIAFGSCSGNCDALMDFYSVLADHVVRNVTSATYIKMMPQTIAVNLSVHFGTTGRILPTNTACTSGSLSIGLAYEAIRAGQQDVMIAGGAESFNPTQVIVFDTLFATSRRNDAPKTTPRAFDRNRDGLVIGEGAGALILEERDHALARGATILAEVVGFGTNTDGRHVTQPNAETMAAAMRLALADAHRHPEEVGYISAHGTATDRGDVAEGTATSAVYGKGTPISTLKSYIGHALGACGAIEAILAIESMHAGWFPPNLNLTDPDPECGELDLIMGEGRAIQTGLVASHNFAFGGVNTALLFAQP
ncbi:MAG: beta-ketoacyl-ACP synthase [Candidatus Spyradenecus sp.]